jgi:NADPH-dependent curcumin reductase CurA
VRSRHPAVPDGAWVTGEIRWSDLATVPGDRVTVVEPAPDLPRHAYVGLLGLSGLTAYFGMTRVLRPLPGERVVVSGASGAVGPVAMQIARLLGARPIGVVGSSAKRATLAQLDLPSVDRTIPSWPDELRERTGGGAEAYFDNVWGTVSARVIELLRPFGRVALCGQMSGLGEDCVAALDLDWFMFLARSLTLQGFRCADYAAERAQGQAQLADWYRSGQVVQQVRLVEGLHGAGAAFADLLAGRGTGKAVVLTGS